MDYEKPDGRKPTMSEKKHYLEMVAQLKDMQSAMQQHWLDLSTPDEWHGLEAEDPLTPKQKRVTLRLDENVLQWYRKLGHGYQRRINQVLRIYMEGVLAGVVQARHFDQPSVGAFPIDGAP